MDTYTIELNEGWAVKKGFVNFKKNENKPGKLMRAIILSFFLILTALSYSQNPLPVIRAGSIKAFIAEGNEEKSNWTLSPDLRPDIYSTTKSSKAKRVKFYTDIDSLLITIKPGKKFEFVVLLNGKDSCFTRIESPATKNYATVNPAFHDTIPFVLTALNNIVVKVILDDKDTLDLKFDSGSTDFRITNDAIKNTLHLTDLTSHFFKIGKQTWDKQNIIPVELSGQGTVGRFGWDIFDGMIVEIDYDNRIFIIHSKLPKLTKGYSKFDMEYTNGLFCIQGELQLKNKKFKNRFLFDNGYQKTIMLDTMLMQEQNYPKDLAVIKKVIMKNGQGKDVPVITVNNERFNLGNHVLLNIPVQLMTSTGNPAGFKTHILGNEVLKRFNTIIDFQHNYVYLKKNSLFDTGYSDSR